MGEGITANQLDPNVLTILSVPFELNDAQIKAWPTDRIEILPAPGVGKMYVFQSGVGTTDFTGGVYGNVDPGGTNGPLVGVGFSAGTGAAWLFEDDSEVGYFELRPKYLISGETPISNSNYLSDYENKPMYLAYDNAAAGNLTGGNPANRVTGTVYYSIRSI